tara:strand:+ start:4874 stop:5329 length:456 start_codon:yes stop_codon:yes gene_type:complete
MSSNNIKDVAINFEAVKVSMSQDKNGTNLRLCIHPDDVPQELHQHWVGSRYMVAMVKLDDENQPELSEEQIRRQRLVKSAVMVCKEQSFWDYLASTNPFSVDVKINSESSCADELRKRLGIDSRSDLHRNDIALRKFESILLDYREHTELL